MKEIVQIVPYLPPSISGVGDYALLLAEELRRSHDIHTSFIVGAPAWEGPPEINGFSVTKIAGRTVSQLEGLLNEQAGDALPVLLQYVGYGYEKRGCPAWLARGLQAWRRASAWRRLVTMFHELYAFGAPWRSSFWSSPLQRWLVVKLAAISDSCVTNMRRYARYLESRSPRRLQHINVLPVFSNVGEREAQDNQRRMEMVIFGGAGWRELAYTRCKKDLIGVCRRLNIIRLHDIGPPLAVRYRLPLEVTWHGLLPAAEIGEIMRASLAGFFTYPAPFLGKSGIFAAYAAHGLAPITFGGNNKHNEDRLRDDKHFLTGNALACDPATVSVVGKAARSWYSEHNLAAQALEFAALLTRPASASHS